MTYRWIWRRSRSHISCITAVSVNEAYLSTSDYVLLKLFVFFYFQEKNPKDRNMVMKTMSLLWLYFWDGLMGSLNALLYLRSIQGSGTNPVVEQSLAHLHTVFMYNITNLTLKIIRKLGRYYQTQVIDN